MSPEEKLAAETRTAELQAKDAARRAKALTDADAAHEDAHRETLDRRRNQVLDGPAGDYVHGPLPELRKPSEIAADPQSIASEFKQAFKGLKDTVKDLADPKGLLGIGSDSRPASTTSSNATPSQPTSDVCAIRRGRDYLASPTPPVTITRIATRGRTQFDEVAAYLASTGIAARPDLVYGIFRVPDRISPLMPGSEAGRVVEWAIVHTAPRVPPPTFRGGPPSTRRQRSWHGARASRRCSTKTWR